MKRTSLAAFAVFAALSGAQAADVKAPAVVKAPVLAPVYDPYTGFSIGGEIGYGFNLGNTSCAAPGMVCDLGDLSAAPQGFVGGGFIDWGTRIPGFLGALGLDGYIGIEGSAHVANLSGNSGVPSPIDNPLAITSKDTWLAFAGARVGLIYQNVMFYGKVGEGWAGATASLVTNTGAPMGSGSTTNSGITYGGGVEFPWFFGPNWLARVDYTRYALGTLAVPVAGSPIGTVVTQKDSIDTIMAGLKYKLPF